MVLLNSIFEFKLMAERKTSMNEFIPMFPITVYAENIDEAVMLAIKVTKEDHFKVQEVKEYRLSS